MEKTGATCLLGRGGKREKAPSATWDTTWSRPRGEGLQPCCAGMTELRVVGLEALLPKAS